MTSHTLKILPVLGVLVSCAATPAPVTPVVSTEADAPTSKALASDSESTSSNVVISEDIRKACGISASEAFFAYDSARVRSQDRAILKKLADCFTQGPLKGREMRLAGRADSRGDEEYNYLLGQRRADSVRSAIVEVGMPDTSVTTTSRGEIDATGTDEEGWAKDRRVDVVLGT
jgi:peptidoglycan-associated lipoprotein